ncbi:MAG: hypothetical protein WC002_08445 [Candidatus Muiribacteriota bacterium]
MKKLLTGNFVFFIIFFLFFCFQIQADTDNSGEKKDVIQQIFERRLQEAELDEQKQKPEFFIQEAEKLWEKGEYEEAALNYKTAFDMSPHMPGVKFKYHQMRVYAYMKQYALLIYICIIMIILSYVMKFAAAFSKNSEKRVDERKKKELKKINDLFISGKNDEVIKKSREILEKTYSFSIPDKFSIYSTLAKSYYKKGVYTSAKKYALDALKLKTAAPDLHDILVEIYLKLNDMSPLAIREYEHMVQKRPADMKLINILFDYYYAKKELSDNAIDIYKKVQKYNPEKIEAVDMLCLRGIRKKDTSEDMITIYEKVLSELRPNDLALKSILLKTYYINKKWEKLYPLVKELIELQEFIEDKNMHKILFEAFNGVNKLDEMNSFYTRLKELYPESLILQNIFEEATSKHGNINLENQIKNGSAQDDISSKGISICSICAHINVKEAQFCEKCGKPLNS